MDAAEHRARELLRSAVAASPLAAMCAGVLDDPDLDPDTFRLTVSIGVAVYPADGSTVDDLLLRAPEVRRDTLTDQKGRTVPRFFVSVDLARLPASYPQLKSLVALKDGPLLASVSFNADGRPSTLLQQVGELEQVTMSMDFDERGAAVTAPPADQITETVTRVR